MGADIHAADAGVRALYQEAEEILGFDLGQISFSGPAEELRQTRVTQPALYVHSYALHQLLRKSGMRPDMAAGHSLGEFTAFAAAGALSFSGGLKLVRARAEAMNRAAAAQPGAMAAVLGMSFSALEGVCDRGFSQGRCRDCQL